MHKAVVEIRDISEAKLYFVHTICGTFATSQEDLTNIVPYHAITGCDAVSDIAGHGKGSAWNVRILTSLQILVRVTFMTKHIQVTREVHLQDVQYF